MTEAEYAAWAHSLFLKYGIVQPVAPGDDD